MAFACGADEVFGLEPQAGGWALSQCAEDFGGSVLAALFLGLFLRRLACSSPATQRVETASSGSIYSALDGEDESEELLGAGVAAKAGDSEGSAALIHSLAADRSPEAVGQLRELADADIFGNESTAVRTLGSVLAAAALLLRGWAVASALMHDTITGSATVGAIELLAWATCLGSALVETSRGQPRSTLVVSFWALSAAAPASTLLRAVAVAAMDGATSTAGDTPSAAPSSADAHRAAVSVLVSLALIAVAACTLTQQHRSTVWPEYQGAWSLQREGTGDGSLDRLLGLGDAKEGARNDWGDREGGSWCPEKGPKGSASVCSKIRRLVRLGRPDAWYIGLGITGFITHATSKVWYQLLWGKLINAVYEGDREMAITSSWQILLASMLAVWCDQYAGVFLSIGGARLSVRLQRQVFNLIMEQDAAFFDRMKTGSLMTILSTNVGSIQNVLVHQTADLAEGVSVTVLLLVYMMSREWRLTMVLVVSTVLPLGVNAIVGWIAEKKTELLMNQQAAQGQIAEEQIGEVRTVKSLGREDHAKELYRRKASATYSTRVKLAVVLAPLEGLVDSMFDGSLVLCFYIGAMATLDGRLGPEFLVSFMLLARNLRDNLGKCFRMVPEFATAVGAAARIFELVDHRSGVNYCGGMILPDVRGELKFSNVWFEYTTRPDSSVLRGLTLHIKPSQTVALVGTSGHGKSTIIDLIQRMYDPSACAELQGANGTGEQSVVTLDGQDLRSLEPRWLRQQLGVVRQEPALFAASVRENVAYGVEGQVSEADVEQALRDANAWEFVSELPERMETQLGEKGVTLSGGQKQRVAIARALLRNPRILLLDEATSALDSESEEVVQAALTRCMAGRTTVVVAHRLSTVENADVIVVLNKGQVLEMGTHTELMARAAHGGRYAELVARQALAS